MRKRWLWLGLGLAAAALLPSPARAGMTIIGTVTGGGYTFTNFDYSPLPVGPTTGTNVNGISNNGVVAGTTVDMNGAPTFTNFSGNPLTGTLTQLNTGAGQTAFGISSGGNVVGGNNTNAFFLPNGGTLTNLLVPPGAINAFGINDNGAIVGQFTSGNSTPGFILSSPLAANFTTINQPTGVTADVINAQGINNNGLVVGFYMGNEGQVHGFTANMPGMPGTSIMGTAVTDPTIKPVEPGATFVFSQILGVNDSGLAVGYYGDSTASQHGYFYNTNTKTYTFLDNPSAAFNGIGVEVTQITGITNSGEIAGFYTDANGTFHSFVAVPVPEPASMLLMGLGLAGAGTMVIAIRRRKQSVRPTV